MNSIEKKDVPDVSGGLSPDQGGCFPPLPDYPQIPGGPRDPFPEPCEPGTYPIDAPI